jgi:alanine racemase
MYGLGAAQVARALEESVDPWGFGVARVDEGAAGAGFGGPFLLLRPREPTNRTHFALTICARRWTSLG